MDYKEVSKMRTPESRSKSELRTHNWRRLRPAIVAAAAILFLGAVPLAANINLEWRPLFQTVRAGDQVAIGLYAVSDSDEDQHFNSAQAIIFWDPTVLQLTGTDVTGSIGLSTSAFLFGNSFGLNEANPPADGDALWVGMVSLGETRPAHPAPEGSLLTYITFTALAESDIEGTAVSLVRSVTLPGHPTARSKVMSGTHDALGTLSGPAIVDVLGVCGDVNCDGATNVFDIDPFVLALVDEEGYEAAFPDCDYLRADTNCDGHVNVFDIDPFVECLVAGGGHTCD